MSRSAAAVMPVAPAAVAAGSDWRVARMAALIEGVPLGEEWDAERLLVIPRPGGLLAAGDWCPAPGCSNLRHRRGLLCASHQQQFAGSGHACLSDWLATCVAGAVRPGFWHDGCVVVGADGEVCPRPGEGSTCLCKTHRGQWTRLCRAGGDWEAFLARARPLSDLGACAVASCYMAACYTQSRLCDAHYCAWRVLGRPGGQRFEVFLARAGQPTDRRVLSLRGLPELVRLELLYAIGCRVREQIRTRSAEIRPYLDRLLESGVASLTLLDPAVMEPTGGRGDRGRFARFACDRVGLAYCDAETERDKDSWDLRLFGRCGRLDFSGIGQEWLRGTAKSWAGVAMVRLRGANLLQQRVQSVTALSRVLAAGPLGGVDPSRLGRGDIDRFVAQVGSLRSPETGAVYSPRRANQIIEDCALVLREAREMGLAGDLAATFVLRRGDYSRKVEELPGRALPPGVVAQLDAYLHLLRQVPRDATASVPNMGALGERAGEIAVLAYQLLKGTGRRLGEVASLHLDCLEVDEHAKDVLVYDNHKRQRMGRRLPLADSELVAAIRAQQRWVTATFPGTPTGQLWLLPRPTKNTDGRSHVHPTVLFKWMRAWVAAIPSIDSGVLDDRGQPVPFDRGAIHPHAWRHTYAQTLADQGVPAAVLRDLMDHRSLSTTLGYYTVGEVRKRHAMELLARHTVDNRHDPRAVTAGPSRAAQLREELSWVAVPMGKCSEPTNVRAGGGACPIRYQCAACPHFESDPSYLPELRTYADGLRRERETMLAVGAADWLTQGVTRQLDVIDGHVRHHEQALDGLPDDQRALINEASATLRKARQQVPVAFGRRSEDRRG